MALKIIGTGASIPSEVVANAAFHQHQFFSPQGEALEESAEEIVRKFEAITGIRERRYAQAEQQTSDLATDAARAALTAAAIDAESLDAIILAHNFGNVPYGKKQSDILPALASRVKYDLKIQNPNCIAFDLLYGCPGWIQAFITAHNYARAGEGKRFLILGAETLSRKLDPHDRDSMIFADGAGAVVLEWQAGASGGVLSQVSQTYTAEEAYFLYYDRSNRPQEDDTRYIKMQGRKIFEFALSHVPGAMKDCLDKAGVPISALKKVLLHQANEKMDEAIIKRFYRLYKMQPPEDIMPMSIQWLGNSSVATVPTLLDLIWRQQMADHRIQEGEVILLASVGAGMSINAICYQF